MEKLFLSNGFRVNIFSHEEIASSLGKSLAPGSYKNVLFVAEQLRFSDDQVKFHRVSYACFTTILFFLVNVFHVSLLDSVYYGQSK